jgi:precorrin-2/cobalt-factor-2 C20-methyltransferase
MPRRTGTLSIVGMGPGDPELLTLKAVRIIGTATVIAFFAKRGGAGHARTIAGGHVKPHAEELRFEYPFTTELSLHDARYRAEIDRFYDACVTSLAARLDAHQDVALLCEGDPLFYGSSVPLFERLAHDYPCEIVPGVTAMSGCWSGAHLPMVQGDTVLTVLPGTLDAQGLAERLAPCDSAVIMKVGRNLPKIQAALANAGRAEGAIYVERGTMPGERIVPLAEAEGPAPYFSLVLVPGREGWR